MNFSEDVENPFKKTPKTKDPLTEFSRQHDKTTKFLVALSGLGVLVFITIAVAAPFKDILLDTLYPKPQSRAQEVIPAAAYAIPVAVSSSYKRVFVTSSVYNGNLGGLSGADIKCQQKADAVNLGGIWKAWLSDDTASAYSRLTHFNGLYKRLDGLVIADNWTDFTDGTLRNKIILDETGRDRNNYVSAAWTGTGISGNNGYNNCLNWTNNLFLFKGQIGGINTANSDWTRGASPDYSCSSNAALYCFEQ